MTTRRQFVPTSDPILHLMYKAGPCEAGDGHWGDECVDGYSHSGDPVSCVWYLSETT